MQYEQKLNMLKPCNLLILVTGVPDHQTALQSYIPSLGTWRVEGENRWYFVLFGAKWQFHRMQTYFRKGWLSACPPKHALCTSRREQAHYNFSPERRWDFMISWPRQSHQVSSVPQSADKQHIWQHQLLNLLGHHLLQPDCWGSH